LPKPFPILVAHLLSNIKKKCKKKRKKKNQGYINCVFSLNYILKKKKKGKGSDNIFAPLFVISAEIRPPKNKYVMKYNEFCYFRTNDAEITKSDVKITPPKKKYEMK
jgi:hypothetical protein